MKTITKIALVVAGGLVLNFCNWQGEREAEEKAAIVWQCGEDVVKVPEIKDHTHFIIVNDSERKYEQLDRYKNLVLSGGYSLKYDNTKYNVAYIEHDGLVKGQPFVIGENVECKKK